MEANQFPKVYNLYPVFKSVEIIKLVYASGFLKIGINPKKGRFIIQGPEEAISHIERIVKDLPEKYDFAKSYAHKSYHNDTQYVFGKGFTFNLAEYEPNPTVEG